MKRSEGTPKTLEQAIINGLADAEVEVDLEVVDVLAHHLQDYFAQGASVVLLKTGRLDNQDDIVKILAPFFKKFRIDITQN